MPVTAKVSDLGQLIRLAFEADVPLLLEGRHGIGKSEAFDQSATALGIELRVLDLSLLEPVDLLGLPVTSNGATTYVPPAILPRDGRGLLLLEELNRASQQTRAPALELLTRRQLHEYKLPNGWLPCAAINPESEGYAVDALDPALLSRFIVVRVEPDHAGWLRWARARQLHAGIISFVEGAPDIFTKSDVTPRGLKYCSDVITAHERVRDGCSGDVLLVPALAGLVGETVAVALVRLLKNDTRPLSPVEVLADYASLRAIVLAAVRGSQLDMIRNTLVKLKNHLQRQQAWDEAQADDGRRRNLEAFLADVPPDLRQGFDQWAVDRGYAVPAVRRRSRKR